MIQESLNASTYAHTKNHAHQLIQGDCRKLLANLEPNSVHMVVTDPPYFLDGLDAGWKKANTPRGTGSVGGLPVGMKFDPRQGRALQAFMLQVGQLLMPVLKPGAFAVFFSQPRLLHRMACGLEDAGFEIRDLYAWHFTKKAQAKAFGMQHFVDKMSIAESKKIKLKQQLEGKKTAQLRPEFEAMILAQKPKSGTHIQNWLQHQTGLMNTDVGAEVGAKGPSTVMRFEKPEREDYNIHLTPKPVALLEQLIQLFSLEGHRVLDPFLGSGSTAVACQNTQRRCVGIEINPEYLNIARQRLQTSL